MKFKFDTKAMRQQSIDKTNAITVGATYFYSNFYDQAGAYVKVLSKTGALKRNEYPSVKCEVVEEVGNNNGTYYAVGTVHEIGAQNLYEKREMASHTVKWANSPFLKALEKLAALEEK